MNSKDYGFFARGVELRFSSEQKRYVLYEKISTVSIEKRSIIIYTELESISFVFSFDNVEQAEDFYINLREVLDKLHTETIEVTHEKI